MIILPYTSSQYITAALLALPRESGSEGRLYQGNKNQQNLFSMLFDVLCMNSIDTHTAHTNMRYITAYSLRISLQVKYAVAYKIISILSGLAHTRIDYETFMHRMVRAKLSHCHLHRIQRHLNVSHS